MDNYAGIAHSQAFNHDYIFHSMLGLLNVQTSRYQKCLGIFAQCTSPIFDDALQLTQAGEAE